MEYFKFFQRVNYKNAIIFSIGDKGIILTIFKEGTLVLRNYARANSIEDLQAINNIMQKEEDLPIYILLDQIEQTITREDLPGVSLLTVHSILKDKLQTNYPQNNLKAYKILDRAEEVKNAWEVIIISIYSGDYANSLIEMITSYPNSFKGVYSLSIETGLLNLKIVENYLTKDTNDINGSNKWQILLAHTKINGFKVTVFKNQNIVYTRVFYVSETESSDYLAGNIEEELANDIIYLQKFNYNNKQDHLTAILITSAEIKFKLKEAKFKVNNILTLTPYEIAEKLNFNKAALAEDKFSDVILAANFLNSSPILRLNNSFLKKLIIYKNLKTFISLQLFIIIPLLAFFFSTNIYEIYHLHNDLQTLTEEKVSATQELQKYKTTLPEEEPTKILKLIDTYRKLVRHYKTPFDILEKMKTIIRKEMTIESIDWRYIPNTSKLSATDSIIAIFKINVYNKGITDNHHSVFEEIDKFITDLSATFENYNIDYNRLTDKIAQNVGAMPLQVIISGPKISYKGEGKHDN